MHLISIVCDKGSSFGLLDRHPEALAKESHLSYSTAIQRLWPASKKHSACVSGTMALEPPIACRL